MLGQGVDAFQRLMRASSVLVGAQLALVFASPFQGEAERPGRKPAVDHSKRVDRDLRGVAGILRVEVRRRVVAEVHVITMP